MHTDEWIVEQLRDRDPSEYFETLRRNTQLAMEAMRLPPAQRYHAYVAVGFIGPTREELRPVHVEIDNSLEDGKWAKVRPEFRLGVHDLGRRPLILRTYGQRVIPNRRQACERAIRKYRQANPGKILGVLQCMVGLVRDVAESSNYVGSNVSVAVLPRACVGDGGFTMPIGPATDPVTEITAFTLPGKEDIAAGHPMIQYGPAMICPGDSFSGVAMAALESGRIGRGPDTGLPPSRRASQSSR